MEKKETGPQEKHNIIGAFHFLFFCADFKKKQVHEGNINSTSLCKPKIVERQNKRDFPAIPVIIHTYNKYLDWFFHFALYTKNQSIIE